MRTRSIHKAALTDAVTPLEESGKKLAYKAAVEGIVLLENDGSLPGRKDSFVRRWCEEDD